MPRQIFLNTSDDIDWLKSVHLKGIDLPVQYQEFKSAVLYGNEDCPESVDLYVSADPLITDLCHTVYFGV